jgi:hypothetical protein
MAMSRRRFLGCAAGAVSMTLPFDLPPRRKLPSAVVLDLRQHCSLTESLAGYRAALAGLGPAPPCRALIVPAAVWLPPPVVRTIVASLQAGATVLFESGAGFASESAFRAHRAVLRDELHVRVEPPVPLWPRSVPYVDYTWPYAAQLRDFSHVVPLARQAGDVIARVDGLPVALKRPSGRGLLIVLGSPLGPALWAGDAAARRWLSAVLS